MYKSGNSFFRKPPLHLRKLQQSLFTPFAERITEPLAPHETNSAPSDGAPVHTVKQVPALNDAVRLNGRYQIEPVLHSKSRIRVRVIRLPLFTNLESTSRV
jgi:hypothetical protein